MSIRVLLLVVAGLISPTAVRAQFLFVDCSGTNPAAYPTINSALPFAGPGAFIAVINTCNENVNLYDFNNLTIAGEPANIVGGIGIINSQVISLYGLNITNASGHGVYVQGSHSIVLDSCSSSGNGGDGLNVNQSSDVTVNAQGTFNNNIANGISVYNSSFVNVFSFAGVTDISNNQTAAVRNGAFFATLGNTHMANNANVPNNGTGLRVAIDMRGGARAQIGAVFGSNIIENNPNGGVSLQEDAEISFFSLSSSGPDIVRNNGPFGIEAGFGSQVTLAGAQITGHTGPGVDIYGHSQLYGTSQLSGLSATQIVGNGTAGDSLSAAIRVDGNSEVLLRGVTISQTNGPAILALVNSSADFAGGTFSGNAGVITCDSSSIMVSDLAANASTPAAGVSCRTPHSLGNRVVRMPTPAVPDMTSWKKMHSDFQRRLATKK